MTHFFRNQGNGLLCLPRWTRAPRTAQDPSVKRTECTKPRPASATAAENVPQPRKYLAWRQPIFPLRRTPNSKASLPCIIGRGNHPLALTPLPPPSCLFFPYMNRLNPYPFPPCMKHSRGGRPRPRGVEILRGAEGYWDLFTHHRRLLRPRAISGRPSSFSFRDQEYPKFPVPVFLLTTSPDPGVQPPCDPHLFFFKKKKLSGRPNANCPACDRPVFFVPVPHPNRSSGAAN